MTGLDIYLWFVLLPNMKFLLGFLSVCTFCAFIGTVFFYIVTMVESPTPNWLGNKSLRKVLLTCFSVGLISGFLDMFIPNTKQAAAIMGISYISQIEGVEKLPENTVKLLNEYILNALDNEGEQKE